MFTELPFLKRFQAAASAGFSGVECMFPYGHDASVLAHAREDAGVQHVLINAPVGSTGATHWGYAALPGSDADYERSLQHAVEYAQTLGCPRIHVMAGVTDGGSEAETRYIRRLQHAGSYAAEFGIDILIEPINTFDVPGYFLSDVPRALLMLEKIDHPHVKLQLDIYHVQIMTGGLTRLIEMAAPVTGHVQIAAVPARDEPCEGEIHYPYIFTLLDAVGYNGWVGCEYRPKASTEVGLDWFEPYRRGTTGVMNERNSGGCR
ncbi:hydroxypyruvate isomerase family protein [Nesterenkonia muleiensis]|uniref:hydroxypyruvate isomerase family protein n=1 Tax=Nesterenkonia muleiensis TaxID=2282648 RepID=UPI002367DD68|nr:TIM barrel protein [Nesterenkonia muleiensis]